MSERGQRYAYAYGYWWKEHLEHPCRWRGTWRPRYELCAYLYPSDHRRGRTKRAYKSLHCEHCLSLRHGPFRTERGLSRRSWCSPASPSSSRSQDIPDLRNILPGHYLPTTVVAGTPRMRSFRDRINLYPNKKYQYQTPTKPIQQTFTFADNLHSYPSWVLASNTYFLAWFWITDKNE